jgi:hypothetical protein
MMLIFKRTAISVGFILSLSFSSLSQQNDLITVRAGTRILDYFPNHIRYRYPEFVPGKVFFHNDTYAAYKLNYSYLVEEMHYIASRTIHPSSIKRTLNTLLLSRIHFCLIKFIWKSYGKGEP